MFLLSAGRTHTKRQAGQDPLSLILSARTDRHPFAVYTYTARERIVLQACTRVSSRTLGWNGKYRGCIAVVVVVVMLLS